MKSSNWKRTLLGIYLTLMSIVLACLVLGLWYTGTPPGKPIPNIWSESATLYGWDVTIHHEFRLILLVILSGALGSYVHASTSFATYVGNRSLVDSWIWWYVLRPFIGMALALIFYFALRGGILLLSTDIASENISPFGIGAISGLVGMFSKQATAKLSELFDNLFRTEPGKGDDERKNKLGDILPVSKMMVPFSQIIGCTLNDTKTEKEVKIKELYDLLKGIVTRIPIFEDDNTVKYVIHESMLYKFISKKSMVPSGASFDPTSHSLEDLLSYSKMRKLVSESIAFVSLDTTLGEAKSKMEETEHCQDVFVTKTGKRDEPVEGWLTNIQISKHTKT